MPERFWQERKDTLRPPKGRDIQPGMKVRFVGATEAQVQWGGNDDPNKVLKVGQIYMIDAIKVHSWHTKVRILGFEGAFNSVSFKAV